MDGCHENIDRTWSKDGWRGRVIITPTEKKKKKRARSIGTNSE